VAVISVWSKNTKYRRQKTNKKSTLEPPFAVLKKKRSRKPLCQQKKIGLQNPLHKKTYSLLHNQKTSSMSKDQTAMPIFSIAPGRGLREAGPWLLGGARCAAWPVVKFYSEKTKKKKRSARGPSRVLAHKLRRSLTTNAFESTVSLLLRRDPQKVSASRNVKKKRRGT
jgi:hypothetical protein